MNQCLVISLIGPDQPGLLHQFAKLVSKTQCSIENSRLVTFGEEAVMSLLITGSWDAIAKLEMNFPAFEKKYKFQIISNRSSLPDISKQGLMPYNVELITAERTGVIEAFSQFFEQEGLNITELSSNCYTSQTGTQMASLVMRVMLDKSMNISDLRERFMLLCEHLNIDAVLEPERY